MNPDPAKPDFVTRLVDAIKSAMGLKNLGMSILATDQPMPPPTGAVASPKLRAVFLAAPRSCWPCEGGA
jgi:hypothetical protein